MAHQKNSLKKLSRAELLELLLTQTQEAERLKAQLEEAEAKLAEKYLHMQEAGDLAHAVLRLNGVMEAVQNAVKQYLENIKAMEEEARVKSQAIIAAAEAQAEQIRREARAEAQALSQDQ